MSLNGDNLRVETAQILQVHVHIIIVGVVIVIVVAVIATAVAVVVIIIAAVIVIVVLASCVQDGFCALARGPSVVILGAQKGRCPVASSAITLRGVVTAGFFFSTSHTNVYFDFVIAVVVVSTASMGAACTAAFCGTLSFGVMWRPSIIVRIGAERRSPRPTTITAVAATSAALHINCGSRRSSWCSSCGSSVTRRPG